jgi:hypothetical protein
MRRIAGVATEADRQEARRAANLEYVKSQARKLSSKADVKRVRLQSESTVAAELRRVLLAESLATPVPTKKSEIQRRGVLDLTKEEAQIGDTVCHPIPNTDSTHIP